MNTSSNILQVWELDTDHDFLIDKENLIRYGNHALTYGLLKESFLRFQGNLKSKVEGKMGYEDFVTLYYQRRINLQNLVWSTEVIPGFDTDDSFFFDCMLQAIRKVFNILFNLNKLLLLKVETLSLFVSESQFAFIHGRQILDCSFIANEGIDLWRKKGLKGCVFKVDFKKAYDTVDWNILFKVMNKMGFGSKWCNWIRKCVTTVSVSVLVNGVPSVEFPMAKGLRQGHFPTEYLGLPLGAKRNSLLLWDPIVQNFYKKLVGWKAHTLSIAGRLILLKIVLCSLPIYFMSLFKIPSSVIAKLNSIMASFLWGGGVEAKKIQWVNRSTVCVGKNAGGLGFLDISYMNRALLGKWSWRFANDRETMWKKVICCKFNLDPNVLMFNEKLPAYASWIWKSVVSNHFKQDQFGVKFRNLYKVRVGDGGSIKFWYDCWAHDYPLNLVFLRMFVLSVNKYGKLNEFGEFRSSDGLVWRGNGEGVYTVNSSVKLCCPASIEDSFWMKYVWRDWCLESGAFQGNAQNFLFAWEELVPNSKLWSFIPGVVLWSIWKWRNAIVFDGGSDPSLGDSCSYSSSPIIKIVSWSHPQKGFIKLNVDAAVTADWRKSGVGGILRVEDGSVVGSFKEAAVPGPPILIELMAIKKGLSYFASIRQRFKERLIVESDSKLAVDWVKNRERCPYVYIDLLKDIGDMFRGLNGIIRWVARSANVRLTL
ncbi:hypothetical protein F3Y22_tig00112124pilonHSYRG00037 [Hibiscus syriacus]|uniref:Reverse transcriptase domain-containing protein n=1 Tax=Hibiscus syriacus TaxID=106335 RepID=A0A6A2Y446_HIBSY|nr:hypothetical protein F3Y22_tig00112124pilonHSYRG00037 [Hibiscus syriacus]